MNKYMLYVLAVVLLAFPGGLSAESKEEVVKVTRLCDMINQPEKYEDREVKFVADFYSGFMQYELLSDPNCSEKLLLPSFESPDGTISTARETIDKALKDQRYNVSLQATFVFTGILKKNAVRGVYPIKGLLQGYTMILISASYKAGTAKSSP